MKLPIITIAIAFLGLVVTINEITKMSSIENDPNFQGLIPELDPGDLEAHMVYCIAPWQQIIAMFFSPEQWQMLHQLSKMSGQDIEDILCEIAEQRYSSNANGLE